MTFHHSAVSIFVEIFSVVTHHFSVFMVTVFLGVFFKDPLFTQSKFLTTLSFDSVEQ
jgi:hypothetical protein